MNGRNAVMRRRDAWLAFLAALLTCLLPAGPAFATQIELSDLLDIDPLGYQCIPSQYFDDQPDGSAALAFTIGKKARLPRTCLPDPCARALTPRELSSLTGTEPILATFSEEWDDYYARYADHCVREVTVSRPRAPGDFWAPIISKARITQRTGIPTSSRFYPYIPGAGGPPRDIPTLVSFAPPGALPVGPSPIPVPASGAMFAAVLGIGALAAHRRRKRDHPPRI